MFNKFPKRTGIYKIKDNIDQLELRVYIRHVNSLLKLPKFDYNKSVNGEWRGRDQDRLGDNVTAEENEIKTVDIKWQEKLFSASEEQLFMDSKNCLNETQMKYHEWLLEKAAAESAAKEIQTAVSGVSNKRRRKKREKKQIETANQTAINEPERTSGKIYTYVHEDNFQNKVQNKTSTEISETAVHMFIFAADIDTELVHLQWCPQQRMLHIYPDFNTISTNPYFIEIDKDYRHLYAYAVVNISKARPATYATDLSLYLPELAVQPHWRTESERDAIFSMPPKHKRRVSFFFELRDAGNFIHDGKHLHVRYHIQLPPHTIHEEGLLEASTHSSSISDSGIHHFGYNWQLTLLCDEKSDDGGNLLHIYFEVISIDSWERERCEGYAHLSICLVGASALELHRLQCLRPVTKSLWSALERFFIGGCHKFDYKDFFTPQIQHSTQNRDHQDEGTKTVGLRTENDEVDVVGGFHSRYSCRMQSTGYLQLSCQRLVQRNCELLQPCTNRRSGMTLDDIMNAYREARKRLEAVTLSTSDVGDKSD